MVLSESVQEIAKRLVDKEVYCSVDDLVRHILQCSGEDQNSPITWDDIYAAYPDFDSMTKKQLKKFLTDEYGYTHDQLKGLDKYDLLEMVRNEYNPEVIQYLAISDWLGRHLKDYGEIILDTSPTIWANLSGGSLEDNWGIVQTAKYLDGLTAG